MNITKLLFIVFFTFTIQTYFAKYIKKYPGTGDIGLYYATDTCLDIFDHSEKYTCNEDGTPGKVEIYSTPGCEETPTSIDCEECECVDAIGKGDKVVLHSDGECKEEPSVSMIVESGKCVTIKPDEEDGTGGMSVIPTFKTDSVDYKYYVASGTCESESLDFNAKLDQCIEITGQNTYLKASSQSSDEPTNEPSGEISHYNAGLLLIDLLAILFL